MAGAMDDDAAEAVASGRDAAASFIGAARDQLRKVFLLFVFVMLLTIWALRAFVWDALKRDLLFSRMDPEIADATSVVVVTPFDVILLQVKIGLIVGLLVVIPALIWVGRDALRARGWWPADRIPRWKLAALVVMIGLLFTVGLSYAYFLFFPIMFEFLAKNAVNVGFDPTYSIVEWTEFIVLLMISFGLAAQLPLAMSGLARLGVIKYETFRDKWRYAVMGIFVFGAMFSPPDPFTQIMWALPLIFLYGVSLGVTKLVVVSARAGEEVPPSAVFRERWNMLAAAFVLAAAAYYSFLLRGGLAALNDLLTSIGSSYRVETAEGLGAFGLAPTVVGALAAAGVGLFAIVLAFFYFRIVELERLAAAAPDTAAEPAADAAAGETDTTSATEGEGAAAAAGEGAGATEGQQAGAEEAKPAQAGDPAEIDLAELSSPAIDAAPVEAFASLSEDEALAHASRAMDNDEPEKAQKILDRWDEAQEMDVEAVDAGGSDDDSSVITSTTAGMVDAFTQDETDEDDIGGYYYDIAFILDSLTSKAMYIVAVFMIVLAGSFGWLYTGGIRQLKNSFLRSMPAQLASEVSIVTLHPVEALIFMVKFSTLAAALSILPVVLYFAWPAIEERGITTGDRNALLAWGVSLFVALIGGSLLGFQVIAPSVISWLAEDAIGSNMVIAYRIKSFGWLVIFTTIGVGVLAEIPVTMLLFHRGRIIAYRTMHNRWREVVIAFFAMAGFLSPKGIFTMFILAIPASIAYGTGLAVLWLYTLGGRRVPEPDSEAAD